MSTNGTLHEVLTSPLYTYAEADRLAGTTRGTAKRWLTGYDYADSSGRRVHRPPVGRDKEVEQAVSFVDLIEIVAIGGLKGVGFSLHEVRRIASNCREMLGVDRPLTSLKFKVGGKNVFIDASGQLIEVGAKRRMRAWREVLEPFLRDLDYSDDIAIARRWWPLGRSKRIVIDPEYAFGLPSVVKSGVRTEVILERFRAGDLEQQIAKDFNLKPIEVERALQFELSRAA